MTLSLHTPIVPLRVCLRLREHGLLRTPQLAVQPGAINEVLVRAALGDVALAEDDDDVRVVDGAQPVGDEDGGAFLFLDKRVDVVEKSLLRVRV